MKLIVLFCILLFCFNCVSEKRNVVRLNQNFSDSIVLFNIGSSNRNDIANALIWLRKCEPKVVAINTIFRPNNFTSSDTALSIAIKSLGNVILISGADTDSVLTTDIFFRKNSIAEGVIGFSYNDEKIFHKLTMPVGDQLKWSFPFTVASYYKIELASQLLYNASSDTFYDVFIDRQIDQFFLIDINDLNKLDCSNLKNKIILLGDLDDTTEDHIILPKGNKKLNMTIILANIIENLLNNKLIKSKDIEY